ncbi:protein-tyrosine phosphatase-like protein [Spinellus fusiger]|nr:protein-tyrosine phosphatase-like protein [Spinellus fusiger]
MNSTLLPKKRLSLALPSTSAPSGLASRRRANKNLSLCLDKKTVISADLATPSLVQPETPAANPYRTGPVRIMPYLYLGSESNAIDLEQLRQCQIQCVLNVAAEVHNPHEHLFQSLDDVFDKSLAPSPSLSVASTISTVSTDSSMEENEPPFVMGYKKLSWQHHQTNLATELEVALETIRRARDAGQAILVHCQCGVARSATVIIAYVMKTLRLPLQEAYEYVKARAPAISPNLSLLYQLREFEQKIMAPVMEVPHTPSRLASLSFSWKRKARARVDSEQSRSEEWWRLASPIAEDVPVCF